MLIAAIGGAAAAALAYRHLEKEPMHTSLLTGQGYIGSKIWNSSMTIPNARLHP